MNKIRSNQRRKTHLLISIGVMGIGAFLLWLVFYSGLIVEQEEVIIVGGSPPPYSTPLSLEERILEADVIARVRLRSVSAGAEVFDPTSIGDNRTETFYVGSLEYEFDVLEYLKGSGGSRLVAIANGYDTLENHRTRAKAVAQGEDFLAARDTRWEDREAIVFLEDNSLIITSTQQPGRYRLGARGELSFDNGYAITSVHAKKWLPAASATSGASGSGEQRFLTDAPSDGGSGGASGASEGAPSMTLAELKARIAEIETEVNAGDRSEEYRECLIAKYRWERDIQYYNFIDQRYDYDFQSGLPAGTWVYEDWRTPNTREHILADPKVPRPEYWLEGRDKDLFYVEDPGVVFATRPLPKGEYKMFYQGRGHKYIICDAYPESERTRDEYVVDVIPPDGVLHEAFFDPVAIGTVVGADAANGVLKPASFTAEGIGGISIERIEWADRQVKMRLSPHNRLAGHHIDFIALDGTIALRLDFDDATEMNESGARSLAWGVCVQPWQDGDLLMLRISKSESELTDVTNDAACAPTPTATPTPQPTPASTPTASAAPTPRAATTEPKPIRMSQTAPSRPTF